MRVGLMEVFIMSKIIFNYLKNDKTYLEREPLSVAKKSFLAHINITTFGNVLIRKEIKII